MIPKEVDIACHNSSSNCTISGPAAVMDQLVEELVKKDIFVRKVNSSNIAYHSRYVQPTAPHLLRKLKEVSLSLTLLYI